jgi:hypothetical protein
MSFNGIMFMSNFVKICELVKSYEDKKHRLRIIKPHFSVHRKVRQIVIMSFLFIRRGDRGYTIYHNGGVSNEWHPSQGWLLVRLCINDAEESLFTSAIAYRTRWLVIRICCLYSLLCMSPPASISIALLFHCTRRTQDFHMHYFTIYWCYAFICNYWDAQILLE